MVLSEQTLFGLMLLHGVRDEEFWDLVDGQASVLLEFFRLLNDLPDQKRLGIDGQPRLRVTESSVLHDASLIVKGLVFGFVSDSHGLALRVFHI